MSLAHAILGLLQEEPLTGYDLKTRRFDSTINHFWSATQAQIYQTLDKLNEQGLVESRLEIQEGAPNRKVYYLTPAGEEELLQWLITPQEPQVMREALMIQLWFGGKIPKPELLKLLEERLAYHRKQLIILENKPIPKLADPNITRRQIFCRLTLERGLAMQKTLIEWLEMCKGVIAKL
jgi:PadR family transcriptional regulator, regulatory protein AphA